MMQGDATALGGILDMTKQAIDDPNTSATVEHADALYAQLQLLTHMLYTELREEPQRAPAYHARIQCMLRYMLDRHTYQQSTAIAEAVCSGRKFSLTDETGKVHEWSLPPIQGNRVVDLGCGKGKALDVFARKGAEVIGIESNPLFVLDHPGLRLGMIDIDQNRLRDTAYSELGFGDIFETATVSFMSLVVDRTALPLVALMNAKAIGGVLILPHNLPLSGRDDAPVLSDGERIRYTVEPLTSGKSPDGDFKAIADTLHTLGFNRVMRTCYPVIDPETPSRTYENHYLIVADHPGV